jgi:hypothetical protein
MSSNYTETVHVKFSKHLTLCVITSICRTALRRSLYHYSKLQAEKRRLGPGINTRGQPTRGEFETWWYSCRLKPSGRLTAASIVEMKNDTNKCRILVRRFECKKLPLISRRGREGNEMDLKEEREGRVDWINLSNNRYQWPAQFVQPPPSVFTFGFR